VSAATPTSRRGLFGALLVVALGLFAADASAVCTITCSCSVSTTNVVFGAVSPLSSANTDSVGGVSVTCGGVAGLFIPLTVDISKGGGSSFAARRMAYGGYTLSYNLYTDNGRSSIFGDGTNGTTDVSSSIQLSALGTGPTVSVPVYGRVFGSQTSVAPGPYSDAISVTLTYY
jgi:spore coat protein U-like protein